MILAGVDRQVHRVIGKPDAKVRALASLIESAEDLDEIVALAGMSDDFIREAAGRIRLIPEEYRYYGPHMTLVMLPFALPSYSRFSDGTKYGVWYAGDTLKTAAAERGFHFQRWLALTPTPPQAIEQTSITAFVRGKLHDIRKEHGYVPATVYDPNSYLTSQMYGKELWQEGSSGLLYSSVRAPGAECLGLYRPSAIKNIELGTPILYHWNGSTTLALQPMLH